MWQRRLSIKCTYYKNDYMYLPVCILLISVLPVCINELFILPLCVSDSLDLTFFSFWLFLISLFRCVSFSSTQTLPDNCCGVWSPAFESFCLLLYLAPGSDSCSCLHSLTPRTAHLCCFIRIMKVFSFQKCLVQTAKPL